MKPTLSTFRHCIYKGYDAPLYSQNYNIYKRIALDMFNMSGLNKPYAYSSRAQLRNMLLRLVRVICYVCM